MDAGNQQLLEKLIGVEKNLDTNSLVTKVNSLDNEIKMQLSPMKIFEVISPNLGEFLTRETMQCCQ